MIHSQSDCRYFKDVTTQNTAENVLDYGRANGNNVNRF